MSVLVRMEHVRSVFFCSRGTREFCARHGIDYTRFLKEGIPVEELEHFDDAMLNQVIEAAKNGQQ